MGTPADAMRFVDPAKATAEEVIEVWRWTPKILSFRVTRPSSFRFTPGHYARVGLVDAANEVVWRPLSMVSADDAPFLEFVVVLVPDGKFSGRLDKVVAGDQVYLDRAAFGFLTLDELSPGENLWLLASGTGVGPFISILRGAAVWQSFARISLIHSVRQADELVYGEFLRNLASEHGEFRYVQVVTRPPFGGEFSARIPQLLEDATLERAVHCPLESAHSRVLVCGNPDMSRELRALLTARGFATGRRGLRGQMAFEKYW